nr:immunoglobulin light chain junction region [Macaca mulatta]
DYYCYSTASSGNHLF